jgi:hypothetical protein
MIIQKLFCGACCLQFYEHVGTTCVCMYIICLLRVWYGFLLKFLHLFCGKYLCKFCGKFCVNISFLRFEAYFCHSVVQISQPYKSVGRANVLYNFNLVLLCTKFGFSVLRLRHRMLLQLHKSTANNNLDSFKSYSLYKQALANMQNAKLTMTINL